MRPTQVATAIRLSFETNLPLMIHGSPGIGKSEIVDQTRIACGYEHLEDVRLSQLDQVDLRGVPSIAPELDAKGKPIQGTGITVWNPPEFLKLPPKSVLFLDEINSAPAGVMAAAYQLVLNRQVGNVRLPDDCRIICAGNLSTDFAMVNQMPSALKNRMSHVTLDVNNDDWCHWAIESGQVHEAVISFLRFRPGLLNEFDQTNRTKEAEGKAKNMREATAFATPRTWVMLSKYLHGVIPADVEYEIYQGIIGEAATAEFVGFQKHYRALPNIDQLLMNPTKTPVPEEPATLYALSTALAARATPDNMERVMQYTERMRKEFQVLTVRDATLRNVDNSFTKAFNQWSVKNADLIS